MTIEEAVDTIRFVVSDKMPGKVLSNEELNSIFKLADYDLYNDLLGLPGSQKGYETEQFYGDVLDWHKTTATVALVAGVGTLPTNFFRWAGCLSGSNPVELVTEQEFESRTGNAITLPSTRYPIAKLYKTTVQVYPSSLTSVSLTYLKRPTHATYALKSSNGIQEYDSATSVQFDWPDQVHISLIRNVLKYLGIAVNDQFIVQYSEQKNAQAS